MRRLFSFLLTIGLLIGGGVLYARHALLAPGPLAADKMSIVPRGGGTELSAALERDGVIAHAWQFRLAALVTHESGGLRAGEFAFTAGATLADVLTILRTARPVQHKLTIPEGLTARQIFAVVNAADALDGPATLPAEGALLPETYTFTRGTERAAIESRAAAGMERALAETWATRAPDLPLKSPREALVLASIVERETARADERPHVAGVYLNRLRQGMKLQSDPTVAYAANGGAGPLDHGITRAELDRDDPMNTYRNAGLPPNPIASPGIASLRAVTHPAETDDLYFVADGTGGHAFARTVDAHLRNVAHWRAVEAARALPTRGPDSGPSPAEMH